MPQYKEGTCSNCERGPINIHNKTGLCGSCRKVCEYARNPEEREAALRAAKDKFSGKPVFRKGTRRKGVVTPVNTRPGNPLLEPVKTNAQQEQEKIDQGLRDVVNRVSFNQPDPLILTLLKAHDTKISELMEIRSLLLGLKKYGAEIEIPEVRL